MTSNLYKLSYIVNAILIEIPKEYFFSVKFDKITLKFVWKSKDETQREKAKEFPSKTLKLTIKLYKIRKFATQTG